MEDVKGFKMYNYVMIVDSYVFIFVYTLFYPVSYVVKINHLQR